MRSLEARGRKSSLSSRCGCRPEDTFLKFHHPAIARQWGVSRGTEIDRAASDFADGNRGRNASVNRRVPDLLFRRFQRRKFLDNLALPRHQDAIGYLPELGQIERD